MSSYKTNCVDAQGLNALDWHTHTHNEDGAELNSKDLIEHKSEQY